ncbi:adhesion G-protein coupled receptor G5-like [Engraulis encrasicolus]|uniref:adhesion G-protein coupled receptor G5-like n=1 Tax=Engraulis encrasicolus TaxID=184585 RepID=UPI002FD169B5
MVWGQARGIMGFFCLIALMRQSEGENDQDFKMCGTWRHGGGERWLASHLSQGCKGLDISANATTLYITGSIAATQRSESMKPINVTGTPGTTDSPFCVYWEPLVDRLQVEVDGKNHTVLQAAGLQESCCTDLSLGHNKSSTHIYGIVNGTIRTDTISTETRVAYNFFGDVINCTLEFCEKAIEEARRSSQTAPLPSVHFPAALKPVGKPKARVVCTFFQNNTIFNGNLVEQKIFRILDDVVGITVENEIVRQLPEPIKIRFHHAVLPKNHSRTCVSWDTRKDPDDVTWEREGCQTELLHKNTTECHCNHLTYFSILVQVEQRESQCHLEALTYITALGCAISALSCMVLFYSLCKKSNTNSEDNYDNNLTTIYQGLVISLFCLSVLFFLTGTLANAGGESVCRVVGALLHYALLSSFCWMGVMIFYTYEKIIIVFNSVFSYKLTVWYILGFGVPAIPVGILVARDDIYGVRMIAPSDDVENPYMMCWMKDHPNAWLAHYMTNVALLVLVVTTGLVMLVLLLVNIVKLYDRKTAFLSMWGFSCLFGTTWILGLFEFGSLSCAMTFVFCLINTLQGFFLMLRHYVLDWMRNRREDRSTSSSTPQTNYELVTSGSRQ